ncbi:iduronate 2-sulfatase-like isoform X2 [Stylophora pistillata]|uniref:iduronate 2-sulfatase-like isoform X2 n=1 Tax=Stylophora pistillata TaxID=50429 RepID=UPI000C05596E|nr:iduronate 2-sulfatase-like isoform X2 [Stylophora pistillata]
MLVILPLLQEKFFIQILISSGPYYLPFSTMKKASPQTPNYGTDSLLPLGRASNFTDDYPYSWSIPPYHASTHAYKNAAVCPGVDGKLHVNIVCPVDIKKQPEKTLPDIQSTQFALNFLKNYTTSKNSNQPFFLAVGYHKPHIPLKFPKQFLDLYPIEKIQVAADPLLPFHLPPVAYEPWTDLRWRDDIAALNLSFPYERMPDFYAKRIIQSYYAATTYMDSLVGQLLIALDEYGLASNTIVSFVGDHGWALGEHQEWSKFSNFRVATNVPLVIHVPGVTDNRDHGGSGIVSDALVELVDLFPTLAELAALKVPDLCPDDSSNITLCSEGLSFAPLLKNLSLPWKKAIFSQYPRPSDEPQENTCEPLPSEMTIMGYSMQTSRYHYTEWIQYEHKTQKGNWSNIHARELYIDPRDDRNVASLPDFSDLVQELSNQLRKGWRNALPENNYVHV